MTFFLSILIPFCFSLSQASIAASPSTWTLVNEEEGVKSYKKIEDDGSRTVAFRGEGIVDVSPIRILSVLSDTDRSPEWNTNMKKLTVIEKKDITHRIQYIETRVPFPYKNREVVVEIKTTWNKELGAIIIESKSVEDDRAPKDTGHVRAKIMYARYTLKPINDWKSTDLTIEIHADPMGNIPAWLVNLFQKSWARKTIAGIRKRVVTPGIVDLPEIRTYILAEAKRLGVSLPENL
ncbi:MAG: hypothetical protein KA715_03385 [Xanthomonadaceae bacterium]|nr:hypothetical protein [Xanthomonadaceae bacterium]